MFPERDRYTVFPGGPREDPAVSARIWNAGLKKQTIKVLRPFGWEGRIVAVGEELSVAVCDAKDLIFRGKAILA